jgi:DNA polymerase/3'-5' exonuclease PolX
MRLQDALSLAQKVCAVLAPFCERVEVAGSVRRGKAEVHDIDIVAIPKAGWYPSAFGFDVEFSADKVWANMIPAVLRGKGLTVYASGPELLHCSFPDGAQLDLYHARPETWGVILLVRTGSKEHNVKLCTIAQSKGLKLSASVGVVTRQGIGNIIACRTEEEIFEALGLTFVEPKFREVPY